MANTLNGKDTRHTKVSFHPLANATIRPVMNIPLIVINMDTLSPIPSWIFDMLLEKLEIVTWAMLLYLEEMFKIIHNYLHTYSVILEAKSTLLLSYQSMSRLRTFSKNIFLNAKT